MSERVVLHTPDDEAPGDPIIPSQDRMRWIAHHVLPHEPTLRAWLRRRPVAGLETDDVIQETYVLLSRIATVEHITAPRAYAYQVAQSIVLRHLRRARIVPMGSMEQIDLDTTADDEPSPEQQAHARLELQRLTEVVKDLPARCRQTFMLRRFEGLSQRDVAERLGISEGTVEKHMARALHTLMTALRQHEPRAANRSKGMGIRRPRST